MNAKPLPRFQAIALLAALATGGCTAEAGPPPVDPQTIELGESSTVEDANAFVELLAWLVANSGNLLYDDPWTNWYQDEGVLGIAKLGAMRVLLNDENLFHSYPSGVKTGYASLFVFCSSSKQSVRQPDGRCNDSSDPLMGATGTRFGHTLPLDAVVAETTTLLSPNPREVSRRLFTRDEFKEVPFLNLLAASWIQFMTHDWFSHGPNQTSNPITIPLATNDPIRVEHGLASMTIGRTMRDPTTRSQDRGLPVTYVNEVTHWWDGSQIYGSDADTARRLRTGSGGLLKVTAQNRLPLNAAGVEDTGFNRNWWIGLSMMHTLWTLEHNAIAKRLKQRYPLWSDQRLYDTARLINSALMAKIHTVEWTPAILPNETLDDAMHSNWYGLLRDLEAIGITGDEPTLFGIVGNSRNLQGVPFSMPEEFVSVYRMHALMPDSIDVIPIGSTTPTETISVPATRDALSHTFTDRIAGDDLIHSFGLAHPGQLVLNNYPAFLQELRLADGSIVDMGTIDILRDRERGVPRYNEFRRLMQLRPLNYFDQLTDDPEIVAELEDLYDGDIEKLDLLVGMLAETVRPTNFGFGETMFQVFILIASRRLHGDNFYTEHYDAEHYTQIGLDWIEQNTMKTVLLRHYPDLASTGLANVENAFHPW